tara:strand:+ start:52 stop:546 length:495 start_codon:yes stop_codon:yes gene_type:complete
MIVSCEKCNKKFNIKDDLIPEKGRMLQCGNCNNKWFFKAPDQNVILKTENNKNLSNEYTIADEKKKIVEKILKSSVPTKNKEIKNEEIKNEEKKSNIKTHKNIKKKSNLIKKLFVLIISMIALIILVDTFKFQIEKYIPGVNLVLNNLYETLKDLYLFSKDLIN